MRLTSAIASIINVSYEFFPCGIWKKIAVLMLLKCLHVVQSILGSLIFAMLASHLAETAPIGQFLFGQGHAGWKFDQSDVPCMKK